MNCISGEYPQKRLPNLGFDSARKSDADPVVLFLPLSLSTNRPFLLGKPPSTSWNPSARLYILPTDADDLIAKRLPC